MKIEKLNENKIRITFNNSDLKENNIDVHSFMSNSIESQSLFLNMLDRAEQDVGFVTDDYKLSIEAIALSNETFIITVTRIEKENLKPTRVQARRKTSPSSTSRIYKFSSFDDFCNFQNFLSNCLPNFINYFSNCNHLYKYNDIFLLILENLENENIDIVSSVISEFAVSTIEYSDLILHKIKEYGTLLTENALQQSKADIL